ncbi:MAG: metal-dependent hydrolase [Candidatus Pacearchaeota archaeon]
MLFRTHILFALVIFMLFVFNSSLTTINKIIFFIVFIIAAAFPDIDTPKSTIGKKTRPISNTINVLFGHRGFFQSLTFVIALVIILLLVNFPKIIVLSFATGYSSHLLLDMLTKTGICVFWPLKTQVKGPLKTGSLTETFLFIFLSLGFIALIIKNFRTFKEIVSSVIETIFSS